MTKTSSICILGFLFLLSSCAEKQTKNKKNTRLQNSTDTMVGRKDLTNEIAGAAYRKIITGYFIIANKDTSDFECILSEAKNGSINLTTRIPYLKRTVTYRQKMNELKLLMAEVAKDYNFDSLRYISIGRLVENGDIAIEMTRDYEKRFHTNHKLLYYHLMKHFFLSSKLVKDWNELLKPYSIKVKDVSMEKLFFTTKSDVLWASKVETDTLKIPEHILDCMLYLEVEKYETAIHNN